MLNEREAEYVKKLMRRDEKRMRLGWLFMMLLVLGGMVLVITAFLTLREMNDHFVRWVTLPGFVLGISLMVLSMVGVSWVKQQHLIAAILRKLQQTPEKE